MFPAREPRPTSPDDTADREQTDRQMAQSLHQHIPTTLSGGLVMLVITSAVLWPAVNHTGLAIWVTLAVAINAEGWWLRSRFPGANAPLLALLRWRRHFSIGSVVAGGIWGTTAWWLAPGTAWAENVIAVICALAAFGALMHNAVQFRTVAASASATLLLTAAYFILGAGPMTTAHIAIAALLVAALGFVIRFARAQASTVVGAITLGIANERLRRQADAASQAKTRFIAGASHDLRQPLHAVTLLSNLMRQQVDGAHTREALRDTASRLDAAVRSMDELLRGVLDLSHLDAGGIRPQPRTTRLEALLRDVAVQTRPVAEARGLTLRVRAAHLPACVTDPVLLQRVVLNLVTNALRYTEGGGVLLGCRRRGHHAVIEVWDTGIGIDAHHLERVFEEFVRVADGTKAQEQGLGLGLPVARRLVTLLGGELDVSSRKGRGSRFRVRLPLHMGNTAEEPASAPPVPGSLGELAGLRVLLLDDDTDTRHAMAQLLLSWGCEVRQAHDTDSLALHHGATGAAWPELVITDHGLHERDSGVAAVRGLMQRTGSTPQVLVVTGQDNALVALEVQQAGFTQLIKPVAADALREAIHTLIATAQAAPRPAPPAPAHASAHPASA